MTGPVDDLAAMLHPFTCFGNGTTFHRILPDGPACERAAAAIAPRLTPDREALGEAAREYVTARDAYVRCDDDENDEPCDHWHDQHAAYERLAGLAASQPVPTEPEERR